MKFTFWGVRGSIPTPSGPNFRTDKYGGNTTCVTFEFERHTVIMDGGTGLVNFAKTARTKSFIMMFTHYHHDHIQGVPFFFPIYVPGFTMHFFAPNLMPYGPREMLDILFDPPQFPYKFDWTHSRKTFRTIRAADSTRLVAVDSEKDYKNLAEECKLTETYDQYMERFPDGINAYVVVPMGKPRVPGEIAKITNMENLGHPQGTFVYKCESDGHSVVFATDIEGHVGSTARLVKFAENCDLLVHDSQYDPQDYHMFQNFGHSTYEMCADLAKAASVKKLVLTHLDPNHDDAKVDALHARARKYLDEIGGKGIALETAVEGTSYSF